MPVVASARVRLARLMDDEAGYGAGMDGVSTGTSHRVSRDVADSVELIVAAAEEAAGDIVRGAEREAARSRADAESRARGIVSFAHTADADRHRRLAEMCDEILAHSAGLTSLIESVRALAAELHADMGLGDAGGRSVPEPAPSEDVKRPELDSRPEAARLEAARLVALPMAVAGRSRDEVAEHLRSAFDLDDLEPVLERVFGAPAGSGSPARLS